MLERIAGFFICILTVIIMGVAGVIMFIPDGGRYLRIKSM
jgi:hypothetical protein